MVPQWLSLLIAASVILFGVYRLWLAFAGPSDEERAEHRRGLLAMPRRQHGALGIIFLLVGAALVATSFGWNPFRREAATTAPAGPSAPAPGSGPASAIVVE
ncbi:MAG: hypothetical protein KJZ91_17315 [Myxococcales bacterium]|nr:hypothetical protein [Myxococcales bacterium]